MPVQRTSRPLGSFVLRLYLTRTMRFGRVYELIDLRTGKAIRFASATALQRFLREEPTPDGNATRSSAPRTAAALRPALTAPTEPASRSKATRRRR